MPSIEARLPPVADGFPLPPPDPARDPREPRIYVLSPSAPGAPGYRLDVTGRRVLDGAPIDEALRRIEADAKLWVTALSVDAVFVHAGAVAWDGRALLLPAASHRGKSTLVAALLRRGATYYSDDFALLDREGRVWPFAHPLSLRGSDETRRRTEPAELGASTGRGPARPAWVLRTSFRPGAEFRPCVLSAGDTVLALLENAPAARFRPAEVLRRVRAAVVGARGLAGERGEAERVASHFVEGYL